MDANLLRKLIFAANQFDTGHVSMNNGKITIEGDGSSYEATTGTLDKVTRRIKKDRAKLTPNTDA